MSTMDTNTRQAAGSFAEPDSEKAARDEMFILLSEIRAIDGQLGGTVKRDAAGEPLAYDQYQTWRTGAKHARRVKEDRYRFLKKWVIEHGGKRQRSVLPAGSSLAAQLRVLARRAGLLEAVYRDLIAYVDAQSAETLEALLTTLDQHRAEIDDLGGGDDDES